MDKVPVLVAFKATKRGKTTVSLAQNRLSKLFRVVGSLGLSPLCYFWASPLMGG